MVAHRALPHEELGCYLVIVQPLGNKFDHLYLAFGKPQLE